MNKTKTRILASLLCTALIFADIMPTGLVAQAAEVSQRNFAETEPGADSETIISEDSLGEEESTSSEETPSEDSSDGDDATEEQEPSEEQTDKEDKETGEEAEIPESENPEEETEAPEISVPEDNETVEIEEVETLSVLTADGANDEGEILQEGNYKDNEGSDTSWVLYKSGKLVVTGTGEVKSPYYANEPSWCSYSNDIITAEIRVQGMKNASKLFSGCSNLVSVDFEGADTSSVTSMYQMFYNCDSLTDLDLSGFDTENVTSMEQMFRECRNLTTLNVSNWNTGKVEKMTMMFWNCRKLAELDLSSWNTSSTTDMSYMFSECNNLKKLNISGFNTENVTNMSNMFAGCESLTTLDVSGFDTGNVTDMSYMFSECKSLTTLDVSGFDTGSVTTMAGMFDYCEKLMTLDVSSFDTGRVTNMRAIFRNCDSLTKLDVSGFDTGKVTDMGAMFSGSSNLAELNLSGFNTGNVTDMSYMFQSCRSLTELDVSGFNTGNVTTMEGMFLACHNVLKLDVSGFDTGKVTNMCAMFGSESLTELDVSGFDTHNVTNMEAMFSDCESLTELDVSGFDTSKVTDMNNMFWVCKNLTKLDVSGFDTSEVTDMSVMFYWCKSLTELDVSGFDTSKVTKMNSMFDGCENLTKLDVSGFDTGNVRDMNRMFTACESLTELDVSNFNTSKVSDMEFMFYGCKNLTELDLSSFDMGNIDGTKTKDLFKESNNLKAIYAPINLKISIPTPTTNWYRSDTKKTVSVLPTGLKHSILLTKTKNTAVSANYITAKKGKTAYLSGETVGVEDLTVTFYGSDGTVKKLESDKYTTNVDEINQSKSEAGTKTLTVTYDSGSKKLTADIELTVRYGLDETNTTITLNDADALVYDGARKMPVPTVVYDPTGTNTAENGTSVTLEAEKDYTISYRNNINACEVVTGDTASAPTVIIKGIGDYSGTLMQTFTIGKADAPAGEELQAYVSLCKTPKENRKLDLSGSFAAYGKKTGYVIKTVEDTKNIFSVRPTTTDINENGVLTYSTNAGTAEDFATITVQVSFLNYKDATLTVTLTMIENGVAVISGITMVDSVYTGNAVTYSGIPRVRDEDGKNITEEVELTYTYNGTKEDGTPYPATDTDIGESEEENTTVAPTDAGSYTLTVTAQSESFQGIAAYHFTIKKAPVTIAVKDITFTAEDLKGTSLKNLEPQYEYVATGLLNGDELIEAPKYTYINQSGVDVEADQITADAEGIYYIIPGSADAGMNYEISYQKGVLIIAAEKVAYKVTFDMMGHGTELASIIGIQAIKAGSLVKVPEIAEGYIVEEGTASYILDGWYKDKTFVAKQKWNFDTDTVQADTILYACWLKAEKGMNLYVKDIEIQTYTGSAIKPTVYVYDKNSGALLKSGKDYTITYKNNVDASVDSRGKLLSGGIKYTIGSGKTETPIGGKGFNDEYRPYVVIRGKGNYAGNVYMNFSIQPASISVEGENMTLASGFAMKYSDQLVKNDKKTQNPFSSLKYKKAMKLGTDYTLRLEATANVKCTEALKKEGEDPSKWSEDTIYNSAKKKYTAPVIPKGYYGTFILTVTGIRNYKGTVRKEIYVTESASSLMKNATITLGKNQKSFEYEAGKKVWTLTPGYYDGAKYTTVEDGDVAVKDNIFTVSFKSGKSTVYLKGNNQNSGDCDYFISYQNNDAVGTATMTITGNPAKFYFGSKSVTFKIKGTAFNAKNVTVQSGGADDTSFRATMPYTGKAVTQNKVLLTNGKEKGVDGYKEFAYGTDYTISYKNNLKKGTATMTFTANPKSGYSGSFKKTFKITPQSLLDVTFDGNSVEEKSKDTAKNTKDMKWNDNDPATYSKNGATLSFTLKNAEGMELRQGTDYTVSYKNNKAAADSTAANPPTLTIKGKGNYAGTLTVTFPIQKADIKTALENGSLTISASSVARKDNMKFKDFKFKVLDGKKALSVGDGKDYTLDTETKGSDEIIQKYADALMKEGIGTATAKPTVIIKGVGNYTGETEISLAGYIYVTKLTSKNITIEVIGDTTYTGSNSKVEPTVKVTYYPNGKTGDGSVILTDADYKLSYGANNVAGKNKGSVTVTGTGIYGGSVTQKFTILSKDVYNNK